MTHPCGTECVLCTTHVQYRILCKKVKNFYRLNQGSNLKSSDVVSDVLYYTTEPHIVRSILFRFSKKSFTISA